MTGPLQRRAIADGVWFPAFTTLNSTTTAYQSLLLHRWRREDLPRRCWRHTCCAWAAAAAGTMTELECRLADLYGAVLDTDISRHGENQLLTFFHRRRG